MKKIKNKFIITVITLLTFVLTIFFIKNTNQNLDSQAILKSWIANITRNENIINLTENISFILNNWDTITTSWKESLLIIQWWDWSVTRLWGDSSIIINETIINKDLSNIKISFELLAWKTWSNVTSFFWEESYFHQTFQDNEAAVRWTIFNVDLVSELLYVSSHSVSLTTSSWDNIIINENKPFSLIDFDFISLIDFIKNYKDEQWKKVNSELDKIYFEKLKNIINENLKITWEFLQLENISNKVNNIKNIDLLDNIEKNEIYNDLLWEYQKIHFANADTPDLLTLKLELKEAMLNFASKDNQEHLIVSTIYDIKEVKKTNNPFQFQTIINIFSENKETLDNLNIYFPDIINIENLSEDFNAVLNKEIDKMKSLVTPDKIQVIKNLKVSDFNMDLSTKTQKFLDNTMPKEEIQWFIQKLIQWFNSLNK